ncbi:MAG TPA: PAS domain-containing protein, partial [Gaiellaceae bacterium]|nr:PAS domain-containing protein [Gaiellaceae bacterium]
MTELPTPKALLEALFRAVPLALGLVDRDLRFVRVNERLAEIDGAPLEAHPGRSLAEILPPLAATLEPLYRTVLETGEAISNVEITGETPAQPGHARSWVASYVPVIEEGRPVAVLAIVEETTRLRRAEEDLRHLLERIGDAFLALDRDLRYTYVNRKAAELLGRNPESVVGTLYLKECPEAEGSRHHRSYVRALQEQQPVVFEDHDEHADRWFENRVHPTRYGLAVFITEITGRKRADREVREREERARLAAAAARMGIWEADLATGSLRVDERTSEIFGTRIRSVEDFYRAVHPDDRERMETIVGEAVAGGGEPVSGPYRVRAPDGRTTWVLSHATVMRNETGEPSRLVGVVFDITERMETERALRESEELQRRSAERLTIIRNVHEAIAVADSTTETAEAALSRMEVLLGSMGATLSLLDEATNELVVAAASAAVGRAAPVGTRTPLDQADVAAGGALRRGETIRIADLDAIPEPPPVVATLRREGVRSLLALPLVAGEQLIGVLACHFDEPGPPCPAEDVEIARELAAVFAVALYRARAAEALRALTAELESRVEQRTRELESARAEAERANAAKSEFLSRMSHELRTPLNAILGFAQLLQRDEVDRERRESVEQILRAGRHLLELVEELLDVSRIETGALSLDLEDVAVGDVVQRALELVRPLADERRVALGPLTPEARGLVAVADRRRLLQVLLNLLANAVKYNREGGSASVTCARLGDARIEMTVSDSGIGLSKADAERVLLPFERARAAAEVEGTGLGLTVAKALVEAMGGTLRVESTPGEGSRFSFDLPIAQPARTKEGPAPAATRTV